MATSIFPPSLTTNILVNTRTQPKIVFLPAASTIGAGKLYYVKDICGTAATSSIFISTTGLDSFDYRFRPSTLNALMSTNFQSVLLASDGLLNWLILQNYNSNLTLTRQLNNFGAQSYLPLATNATDLGVAPQTVTTNGTVTYTTISGKQCAYFNNSLSNYISLPYTNPTNFTFLFWYYPIDASYYTVVSVTNASFNPALQMDTPSSTSLLCVAALPNQWTVNITATVPAVGNWKCIGITINQTNFVTNFYVNGVFAIQGIGTGTGFATRNLFFLGRSGDNGRAFNGYIRQFAFFNSILTAAEILQYYNATT